MIILVVSVRYAQAAVASKPWEWARMSNPPPANIDANITKLCQERHNAIQLFRTLLVRKRQGSHGEIIAREHLTAGALNKQQQAVELRSCIAMCPDGTPCIDIAEYDCAICNAY